MGASPLKGRAAPLPPRGDPLQEMTSATSSPEAAHPQATLLPPRRWLCPARCRTLPRRHRPCPTPVNPRSVNALRQTACGPQQPPARSLLRPSPSRRFSPCDLPRPRPLRRPRSLDAQRARTSAGNANGAPPTPSSPSCGCRRSRPRHHPRSVLALHPPRRRLLLRYLREIRSFFARPPPPGPRSRPPSRAPGPRRRRPLHPSPTNPRSLLRHHRTCLPRGRTSPPPSASSTMTNP